MALPVKALKAGQETYWLDQIARNREEYFSGRGESPGRFVGEAAATSGLEGVASAEQVRAMFLGLDPATGEVRCPPLRRADPRSKLAAGPLLEALKQRATGQGVEELEQLASSKALRGDVRSVEAACRLGGARRVKVETVERLCRKILGLDPRSLYGEAFERAWAHKGKRVNERVQAFDHCFSAPKSVSLLAAGGGDQVRRYVADARDDALQVAIGYLEREGLGVRRDHNGTDRQQACGGLVGVAFEHRMSRAGDPQYHTHVLVQNAAHGPDGRWTALDSDRLYAHLMAADHLYLAAERAGLTERLGVRWGPVDERSGAAEIIGLDDRALIERFSKRSGEIDEWLAEHGLAGIKASSAAAVATRAPKDHAESEQSVYARWAAELAAQGVGERQLAEVCRGGRGRPATPEELAQALEELSGPGGLTGQASTFTRAEVVDGLAKRLPVAHSPEEALTQVEQVADRFLEERAVRVARDRRVGVDRYSTPELLEVERRLVADATERTRDRCAQVRPEIVRQVLDRHASAGPDQAAMVQDLCRGGGGVAVVVGRAGTGKTWALGVAREGFELDGYQVIGCAPTGIATVSLREEGFSDVRTVDRLLLDLRHGRLELDGRTVLVVDEAGMVGTRKLAPLLAHARDTGSKVICVGDDRQFSSIDAGGGFRGLRLRLGASELTVNRRQVQAWERQAIEDVRAGRVEQAIVAYAEHGRIRAFDNPQQRSLALLDDWWQAHQAAEQPVIYAHRRITVDQLNHACQQLRAQAGQLGHQRLMVGDLTVAVGDRVVLGANAITRLGVANGTSAAVTALDPQRRTLTVRTDESQPRTVTLPGWYLDAQVTPGQSRRVDLAYARTDMRSQGRTEQRALLALDGAEDMQGCYVQLTRSVDRTDLYLTVGPEPLDPDAERPHPTRELRAPQELLARVMTRDGSKSLAIDTPDLPDVRRLSTRELRAERDRLAALRTECPPDRSRELQLANQRATEAEQARQQALTAHQQATDEVAALQGRLLRRRDLAAARDRLALADHALQTTTSQADQAAERHGMLRRHQQRRLGWLDANDAQLRVGERAITRELGWRGRVDQRALALDPPGWLLAELGPLPSDPQERRVWCAAAAHLDGFRRAYGLDHPPPAEHGRARATRGGRAAAAAMPPAAEQAGQASRADRRRSPGERDQQRPDRQPPTHRAEGRHRADPGRLLGTEPRRDQPGRRRDWHAASAALERLADRHRHHRDQRHPTLERPGHPRTVGRDLGRDGR